MTNKSVLYSYFLLFSLSTFSCFPSEKEFEGTYLPGKVIEYGTRAPVEGALVPLFGGVSGDGSDLIYYLIDTVRTDEDGIFEFRTKDDDPSFFEIGKVDKEGYYDDITFENGQNLFLKGDNQFVNPQIILNPMGWIRLIVKDDPSIEKPFKKLSAWFIGVSSISDDFNEIHVTKGNRYQFINIIDNDSNLTKDSIYIYGQDTVTYRYLY